MRKILLPAAVLLAGALPLAAQTATKTIEFLQKVDLSYYCLGREGLKGFTCDLTVSVSDVYKKHLTDSGMDPKSAAAIDGQKLTLAVHPDGKWDLALVPPASSGDVTLDAQLQVEMGDVKKNLASVVDTWVNDVFKPIFGQEDFTKSDCTVVQGPEGFIVEQRIKADGSLLRTQFDPRSKVLNLAGTNAGVTLLTVSFNYSAGEKGYQLDDYSAHMPKVNYTESDHFVYEKAGGYDLPARLTKEMELPPTIPRGTSLTVEFSNYRLNK